MIFAMKAPPVRPFLGWLCALGALSGVSCTTLLSPNQRQELETRVFSASSKATFAAARDTVVNRGYQVNTSDFGGGILTFEGEQQSHNPSTALTLSLICPTAGDFYMDRYGWGVFDLFFWPYSIVWAVPSNVHIANTRFKAVKGTLAFEALGELRTKTRVTISGIPADTEKYPVVIRDLQEEIGRQLFIQVGALP